MEIVIQVLLFIVLLVQDISGIDLKLDFEFLTTCLFNCWLGNEFLYNHIFLSLSIEIQEKMLVYNLKDIMVLVMIFQALLRAQDLYYCQALKYSNKK